MPENNDRSVLVQWDDDAEDFEEVVPAKTQNQHLDKEIDRIVTKINGNGNNNNKKESIEE